MSSRKINDIISTDKLEYALRSIAKATEMNLCMIDILGNVIIRPTNDSQFCTTVRQDGNNKRICLICASHAALEAARQKRPFFYRCPFGLIDFAMPVYYKDEVLGAICGGQIKADTADGFLNYSYAPYDYGDKPYLSEMFAQMRKSNAEKLLNVSDLLVQMTEYLANFGILLDLESKNETRTYSLYKLRPALQYIEKNYNKNVSLQELSSLCFVSESYFSRLFKATMKTNLSDYITNLRIEKAKAMLLDPAVKILAIAYEVGYNDSAYFIRKFKKATGMTPLEYRAIHINDIDNKNQ